MMIELSVAVPRLPTGHSEPKNIDDKFASLGLKLGYNALKEIDGLFDWCTTAFAHPKQLSILDLSFNCLGNIPNELLKFECLKSLYLHGNKIVDVSEVDKLAQLKHLQTLTIHGNPIETVNGTRHYIIAKLVGLRHLNFSGVSKADKQTATVWTKSNHKPLKAVIEGENNKASKERKDSEADEN